MVTSGHPKNVVQENEVLKEVLCVTPSQVVTAAAATADNKATVS